MSGPVILSFDSGAIGGSVFNATGVSINGFSGVAAMFVDSFLDEEMFLLLIGARFKTKEMLCGERRVGADKAKVPAKYRALCSKVKP